MNLNKQTGIERTVADLEPGEKGIITCLKDDVLALKLLEMGFLPGSEVKLNFKAPLGDPLSVRVSGYNVSIRLDEAAMISLH
jgi:ferrous iron transport protein A